MSSLRQRLSLLVLPTLMLSLACSSRNAMGRRQVHLLPDSLLESQASTLFAQEKKDRPLSGDARLQGVVQRVADRLVAQAKIHYGEHCKDFQWEAQLFEAPETVNAYCMPGGKIGIFTGILPVCQNEAGLAVVMGHEVAHALLRHSNARATAQLGVEVLGAAAGAVLEKKDKLSPTTRQAILAAVGMGGQYGLVLPNSRVDENEADHMGLRLMAWAGYDPREAPRVWERMAARGAGDTPEWMSTHPADERRIRRLGEFLPEVTPLHQAAEVDLGLGETL